MTPSPGVTSINIIWIQDYIFLVHIGSFWLGLWQFSDRRELICQNPLTRNSLEFMIFGLKQKKSKNINTVTAIRTSFATGSSISDQRSTNWAIANLLFEIKFLALIYYALVCCEIWRQNMWRPGVVIREIFTDKLTWVTSVT
jgi:hypothetical protein